MQQIEYKVAKYLAIFKITLSNHLAYVVDFFMRALFLIVILFIFTQLWETTFHLTGSLSIDGYTLKALMWYLVFTEAIYMAMPRVIDKVEQEVKNGDIAYFLNRPLSYIGYHYCGKISESIIRVGVNLIVGGALIYLLYGGLALTFHAAVSTLLLIVGAFTLQFLMTMGLSLCAFWIEEVRGYELVYTRFVMILGGMMVPLDIFPEWLETIARALPFQHIIYVPATFAVGTATEGLGSALLDQWVWIAIFLLVTFCIYYLGVKKLNVNGG